MQTVFKESPSTIPTICIENSSCNESSARNSPICDVNSPFLIASNEDFLGKSLSFNVQVSQFLCWFSELTEPRKLLFTALVVKNTSPGFLQIVHTLLEHRLLSFQSPELVQKANSLDHVKSLFSISNPSELTQTLLHLLSHLSTEPSSILSGSVNKDDKTSDQTITGRQGAEYNETIRRYYLDLIDKVFENLSTIRTHKCPSFTSRADLATQHPSSLDDPVDTNEGQILLLAISHPVFDSKDKQWLLSKLLRYRDLSKHDTDEELRGGDTLNSLTTLAADLLDILVESSDPDSLEKHARKSNSSSQFPFFTRSLMSYMNRRHNSLVPRSQVEEGTYLDVYKCGSSLCVPLIAQPSPLSNSSLNSSGFISGSESMHQGLSQVGLNEPQPAPTSYSFHSTPKNTPFRLHPPSSLFPFNPFRRQSASPYASHCAESQLKEGDEESVFLEPHSSSPPRPLAEPANTDGFESSDASPNIPCLVAVQLPRENEKHSSISDVHHAELGPANFSIASAQFQKTSFQAPVPSSSDFCSARPPSSPTIPSPADSIDLQSTQRGSVRPTPCDSTNLPSSAPFYALKLSSGASDSETSLWSPPPSPKPSVFTEAGVRSNSNSLNLTTSPEIKDTPLKDSKKSSEDDSGMECLPLWLKSLRLHKYVSLFQRLTYREMFGITDEWLQRHHVTQGARNKILVSINKLSSRSATLKRLEHEMADCIGSADQVSTLRGFLAELRSILQTPIARFMGGMTPVTPVSTAVLVPISQGDAPHQTHPPVSSPEPSTSLVGAQSTAPSADDVDVEEEEEDEEEEDIFGNEVSEEDEFGDEEDNPEISDQRDFLSEAFHCASRPHLLPRQHKLAVDRDDIVSGGGVLSRITFNNSDTCLHQPKFSSERLEGACLRPATSILRHKSSEDVYFFEQDPPARRNCELSIGRTRRPCKQHSHKQLDSAVGAAVDCNSRMLQLARADRRKLQSAPKPLLLTTAEINAAAIPSEPENLPEQIIRCLFQGFTALLNGAKSDQDNYASFVQLLTVVLDHSSFTKEQKSLASEWQTKLVDALGPAPLRRSYRNTRPSRRPTQYHPSFRSSFYGVRQPSFSLPYMPRPQYRLHSLPLPGAGYPPHHSLSPIRLGPNGYADSADPRPRPGALSPTCALINTSVVGPPSFNEDLQPVFPQQASPYERDQSSKIVGVFAPIPSYFKTPTSSSRSWSTLSAHEDQRQFDYLHPHLLPGPRLGSSSLSPIRAGLGGTDDVGNSERCAFRSWSSIPNPEFSAPSSSRHHHHQPPPRPLQPMPVAGCGPVPAAAAAGQAPHFLSLHRGNPRFGPPVVVGDVPSEGLAAAEPSPVFQSQGAPSEGPFTSGYCKGFPTCRGPTLKEGVMAPLPLHPPRQQVPSQFSIHGQALTHQSSDEIAEITSNLTKPFVEMLLEPPSTNAPPGVSMPTGPPSLAYVGGHLGEFSSQSTLGSLELSKMDYPSVHCTSTAEINRDLDLLTQKVTKLAIDESDSPSE